jgi:hypothetical protein
MEIVYKKLKLIKTNSFYKLLALQLSELFYTSDERKKVRADLEKTLLKNKIPIAKIVEKAKQQSKTLDIKDEKKLNEIKALYTSLHEPHYFALKKNIASLPFETCSFNQRDSHFQIKFKLAGLRFKFKLDFMYEDNSTIFICCLLYELEQENNKNSAKFDSILRGKRFNNFLEKVNLKFTKDKFDYDSYIVAWKNYSHKDFLKNKSDTILVDFINRDFVPVLNKIEETVIQN